MPYGIYKYVKENEIVYIGKSNTSIKSRINAHKKEKKFKDYLDAEIYVMILNNKAETGGMERLLIDQYSPCLNVEYVYEDKKSIILNEPEWIPYEEYINKYETPKYEIPKNPNVKKTILENKTDLSDCNINKNVNIEYIMDIMGLENLELEIIRRLHLTGYYGDYLYDNESDMLFLMQIASEYVKWVKNLLGETVFDMPSFTGTIGCNVVERAMLMIYRLKNKDHFEFAHPKIWRLYRKMRFLIMRGIERCVLTKQFNTP